MPDCGKEFIPNTDAAREAYYDSQRLHGRDTITLTPDMVRRLKSGECLATNDGEYATFVVYKATRTVKSRFPGDKGL